MNEKNKYNSIIKNKFLTQEELEQNGISSFDNFLKSSDFEKTIEMKLNEIKELKLITTAIDYIEWNELRNLEKIIIQYNELYYKEYIKIINICKKIKVNFEVKNFLNIDSNDLLEKDFSNIFVNYKVSIVNNKISVTNNEFTKNKKNMKNIIDLTIKNYNEDMFKYKINEYVNRMIKMLFNNEKYDRIRLYISKSNIKNEIDYLDISKKIIVVFISKSEVNWYNFFNTDKRKNISNLHLTNMNISNIDCIPVMEKLMELDISNNKIKELDNLNLKFPELGGLYASYNNIENFPIELPSINLTSLVLDHNNICGEIFYQPNNIADVCLNNNKIKKFIFDKEKKYTDSIIELAHNEISDIINFDNFKSDYQLYLDYNPIINDYNKIKKLNEINPISVLPRLYYKKKEDIIGRVGLINHKNNTKKNEINKKDQKIIDDIIEKLKYKSSISNGYNEFMSNENKTEELTFLINGKWGSGKTYFYNNILKKELENNDYKLIEYSSTLNNEENPLYTIISNMRPKKLIYIRDFVNLLKKRCGLILMIFIISILITSMIDFFVYQRTYSLLSFDFIENTLNNFNMAIIISLISLPTSLLLKNNEYNNIENEIKRNVKNKRQIVIIDDIERVKVEKQIEIINAIQTLRVHLPIIILTDAKELENILRSSSWNGLDFHNYKNKIFDYEFNYEGLSNFDYFQKNVHIVDRELKIQIETLFKTSEIIEKLSIREIKKFLENIFLYSNFFEFEYIDKNQSIIKKIGLEIKSKYSYEKLQSDKYLFNLQQIISKENRKEFKDFNIDFYLIIFSESENDHLFEKINNYLMSKSSDLGGFLNLNIEKQITEVEVEILINRLKEMNVYKDAVQSILKGDSMAEQHPYNVDVERKFEIKLYNIFVKKNNYVN